MLVGLFSDIENFCRYTKRELGVEHIDGDIDSDMPILTSAFEQHPSQCHGDTPDIAAERLMILERWRKHKTVYSFDSLLLDALYDSDMPELHTELLRRLPYDAFFLDFSGKTSKNNYSVGTFVLIEPSADNTVAIGIVNVLEHSQERHAFNSVVNMFRAEDGEDLAEANWKHMQPKTEAERKVMTEEAELAQFAIRCAYYLAAQNADIKQVKTKKEKRTKTSAGLRANIRKWEVGYRIGADYRKAEDTNKPDMEQTDAPSNSETTRNRPRPHVRRAHWHHFWCGRGRQRLEVQWLSPTFVNAWQKSESIIATKHKVG